MLIDESDTTNDAAICTNETLTPVYNNEQTGQDNNDPSTPNFLEHNWICNDDNRWYPPDHLDKTKATINKISIEDVPAPGQNDSGANHIVTDNIKVKQYLKTHNAWVKYANCNSNKSTLKLIGRDAMDTKIFHIFSANNLWYHHTESIIAQTNEQPIL
jgi:hypothetical protein